jgi:hypothetical protein
LYTKQQGLERNLFLAPGEGDAVRVPGENGDAPTGSDDADVTPSDALRLMRGEIR